MQQSLYKYKRHNLKPNFLPPTLKLMKFLYLQIVVVTINFKTLLKAREYLKLLTDSLHDKQKNSMNFSIIMAVSNESRHEWFKGLTGP
jgi:hypothetical protein